MRTTAELIEHKRDGGTLEAAEIRSLLEGAVDGSVKDYQLTAFMMAVYFQGMTDPELADFTLAMIESGDQLNIESSLPIVDKHSTGGVGDKISIPLAPLVACCDIAVPMMSGRGLGHTGGTLDKLEAIPGMRTDLPPDEFAALVTKNGAAFAGQSERVVPADRRLYALRDTSGTVPSIPLISASIMSKKLSEGLDALVLDIKVGRGAFMKTDDQARDLAGRMIAIGDAHEVEVRAFLTTMDQPLGYEVGNANEVRESIDVLRGDGPPDVTELVLTLGAAMLNAGGVNDGEGVLKRAIRSGAALEKLTTMIEAQGGDPGVIEDPTLLPISSETASILAEEDGYVTAIDSYELGMAGVELGAGRRTTEDAIDPGAGISLTAKVGASVVAGDVLATLSASTDARLASGTARAATAFTIAGHPPDVAPLVREEISR